MNDSEEVKQEKRRRAAVEFLAELDEIRRVADSARFFIRYIPVEDEVALQLDLDLKTVKNQIEAIKSTYLIYRQEV